MKKKEKDIFINTTLIKENKLTKKDIVDLIITYREIDNVIELANKNKNLKNPGSGIEYSKKIEKLEFKLQELWKFSKDAKKHRFWNTFNNCSCPKSDNKFSFDRVINDSCIFHGSLQKELKQSMNYSRPEGRSFL